jgi:hypothetical protein
MGVRDNPRAMQSLRSARILARLVLAWFVLSLGAAIASPLVAPKSFELICSGSGGSKLIVKDEQGQPTAAHLTLDCPMCFAAGGPPPAVVVLPAAAPLAHAVQPVPAARIAALTAAPLPARGPPAPLSIQ